MRHHHHEEHWSLGHQRTIPTMMFSIWRNAQRLSLFRFSPLSSTERYQSHLTANKSDSHLKNFTPVYVHHVSKLVLEHLQQNRSEWLLEKGLDRGLQINKNGTFVLSFPARKGFVSGRIWYVAVDLEGERGCFSFFFGDSSCSSIFFLKRFLLQPNNFVFL